MCSTFNFYHFTCPQTLKRQLLQAGYSAKCDASILLQKVCYHREMSEGIRLPFCVGVSPTLKIRGLIATEVIKKGAVIERSPALIYPKNPKVIAQTVFEYYVFDWDDNHEALALGYGSLVNHSYEANVVVDFDFDSKEIVFTAKNNIEIGDELLINYNDDSLEPIDPGYLGFDKF